MSDKKDKKVVNLFSQNKSIKHLSQQTQERIKFYAGFNYIKLKKDLNGNKFNKDNLLSYAERCHYLVKVMREIDGETILYSYDVPNSDLFKFMKSFEENTLDGTIIDIDKHFPNDLA